MTWRQCWAHQLRWARTIRVCMPGPYAGSILGNATLWPLLLAAFFPAKMSLLVLAGCLYVRIATSLMQQHRLGSVPGQGWYWWLAPVKDLLQVALWIGAFFGGHVHWRGETYRVNKEGKLVKV